MISGKIKGKAPTGDSDDWFTSHTEKEGDWSFIIPGTFAAALIALAVLSGTNTDACLRESDGAEAGLGPSSGE